MTAPGTWLLLKCRFSTRQKDIAGIQGLGIRGIVRKFIAIYFLMGSSVIFFAQTVPWPHGEGSVSFRSAGGKWQRAMITDQLTGESSTASRWTLKLL
jgi:hypothetical protein